VAETAIVIDGVSKSFGDKHAVEALDLVVPRGSICGFIGPNGAGKTTTLRMVLSIIHPDTGSIRVLGGRPSEKKDRIGYLPEERGLYRKMRVEGLLGYVARLKGVPAAGLSGKIRRWLERVGLPDAGVRRCEEHSKGMQQKVQFLAAVIHEPDLLILDEPFSGLDPLNARLLEDLMLEQHAQGRTILLSTHVMSHAERLCERVFMMDRGKKVLDADLGDIARSFDPRTLVVELDPPDADPTPLHAYAASAGVQRQGKAHRILLRDGVDVTAAIREIAAALPLRRIEAVRPSLEDVFLRLAGAPDPSDAPVAAAAEDVV
jgi:ABC-2 type transport system ATP-binding protein